MSSLFALTACVVLSPVFAGCSGNAADESTDSRNEAVQPVYGVDYSWSRPSPASLASQGYTFAARYLSNDTTGKNISLSEAEALEAAGLAVVVVWENGANDSLQGAALGASQAKTAEAQATAAGMPAGRPIYFAIDFEPTSSEYAAIESYFEGVASVIGVDRTGAYGGYGAINDLFNSGKITWGWQTYAWSSGQWDSRAQLRQTSNGIDGGDLDEDEGITSDFGQWGATVSSGNPPPATTCTANGVAGTCIDRSTCGSMSGYVSTAGLCPGASNIECCTKETTTPTPPAATTCTANGVAGTCIATSTCASMAGYVSTSGLCAGAADIECCTKETSAPPPPAPTTCTADGVAGTCIATSTCAGMLGYTSTAGLCAGAADIECCTPPASCSVNGTEGVCISTSSCAASGRTSTPGHCGGPASEECCTP